MRVIAATLSAAFLIALAVVQFQPDSLKMFGIDSFATKEEIDKTGEERFLGITKEDVDAPAEPSTFRPVLIDRECSSPFAYFPESSVGYLSENDDGDIAGVLKHPTFFVETYSSEKLDLIKNDAIRFVDSYMCYLMKMDKSPSQSFTISMTTKPKPLEKTAKFDLLTPQDLGEIVGGSVAKMLDDFGIETMKLVKKIIVKITVD